MKSALVTVVSLVTLWSVQAAAQMPQTPPPSSIAPPLADVAKTEEARRKTVRKPAKVYTNGDLKTDFTTPASPASAAAYTPADASSNGSVSIPLSPEPPSGGAAPADSGARDEKYWRGRIAAARETLNRSRMFADALQSRINALNTDIVNRDDPAQKMKLEQDRRDALAELERVNKEMDAQNKAITAVEDEARRAGVPAGWLRPA